MAYIGPAPKFGQHQKQVITGDSSTVTFTLDYYVTSENNIMVIYNGVIQEPGAGKAYTTSGNSITFSVAPTTGSTCWIIFLGQLYDVGTVADNAIVAAKIAAGAVTAAKLDSAVATPILLSTVTASASATVDFDSGIDFTAYDRYLFRCTNIILATDDITLRIRVSTDGGTTYLSTGYNYTMERHVDASSTYGGEVSTAASGINLCTTGAATSFGNAAGESFNVDATMYRADDATLKKYFTWTAAGWRADNRLFGFDGWGTPDDTNDIDGVRFIAESGNITSGTFKLYGLI